MTLHISYDHECEKCGCSYIPYDRDIPCPRCGALEEECFEEFADEAAASALYNMEVEDSFQPEAWAVCSVADNILSFLFELLDCFVVSQPTTPEEFVNSYIEKCVFEDCKYMRSYLGNLALRVMRTQAFQEFLDLTEFMVVPNDEL